MRVKWSQNFLVNPGSAKKSVDALRLNPEDFVLEIGPGRGILTGELLKASKKVAAVEIDPSLVDFLRDRFQNFPNFKLIHKDFLNFSEGELDLFENKPFKVIGNLPYAIVSAAIQKILSFSHWTTAVLMVQKEVADRILAPPGKKEYGILSIAVQSQSKAVKLCSVSRYSFKPAPKVDSTCIQLFPLKSPAWGLVGEKKFFTVVKAAFAQRRKTLVNSLTHTLSIPAPKVKAALTQCGIPELARAETLSIPDFVRLSEELKSCLL